MPMSRRTLLIASGATVLAGPAPESGPAPETGSAPQSGRAPQSGTAPKSGAAAKSGLAPAGPDWAALDASLDGTVERPGTAGYESARRLQDPRFDGVRPPAVARCAHAADVAEALRFAARHGVPVVARGGGHSYVGASTSGTALVLDLRRLAAVTYDPATRTAGIGGGARLIDVYDRLGGRGVSVPSGSCGSVGISGITLGGGIGLAASAYGLTCDAVVSVRMVTADGRLRTLDATREPDLFWAVRGGGGGRFGAVVHWRMRTFTVSTAGQFTLTYAWRDAAAVAAGWQARLTTAPDAAWSTCQFIADAQGRRSVRINGFVLGGTAGAEAAAVVRAIGREPAGTRLDRRPYLRVVHDRAGCDDTGDCGGRDTELVGSDMFAGPLPATAVAALLAVVERRAGQRRPGVAKLKRMTGAPARVRPDATAFPWRGAHTMLQWLVMPAARDAATVRDGYSWIDSGHRALARWSSGRYVNYLEPDPAAVPLYHGPHLARLRRIRAAVDPDRRFRSPNAL
jgi:FAD/FMN-containing dehydrogenase